MYSSHRSLRDVYFCKGDRLLAQTKLGRGPQTVIFAPLILLSSGAVDLEIIGVLWDFLFETMSNEMPPPSVSAYLVWGSLVLLFSVQNPWVSDRAWAWFCLTR